MIRTSLVVMAALAVVASAVPVGVAAAASFRGTPAGFATSSVEIPATGGVTLAALVMQPSSPGLHPLAVLISAWGGGRTQNIVPAKVLADRGYTVVAYAARGFGESGGEVEVAGPDDITDVSTVIDWALAHTAADPKRIGLSGVSYGAGIAMLAAGFDGRIKAVATSSGWADLSASLAHDDTRRGAAAYVLYMSGKQNGRLSPESDMMLSHLLLPGDPYAEDIIAWSKPRSPSSYVARINANHAAVLSVTTWSENIFPPQQLINFFGELTGPKRFELVPGDHASTEYAGLVGLPDATWTSVYRWLDAYVAGTDTSIKTEEPLVLRPRPGTQKPEYATAWADVVGTRQRFFLGRPGGPDGTLGTSPAAAWTTSIAANTNTVADGGYPLTTYTLETWTGNPPTNFMFQVDRTIGSVFTGETLPTRTEIRGAITAHLTATPSARAGSIFGYVYDVGPGDVGSLVGYTPTSWRTATPGQPMPITLTFEPTAYSLAAGHHLALVLDSKDVLFADWNSGSGRTGIASTAADPSFVDVPIRTTTNGAPR